MEPSKNAAETPKTLPADEAWRRFTLLDLLILFSGHEAALGLMKWYGLLDLAADSELVILRVLAAFLIFLVFGAAISLPPIYLVQYWPRGRRARLSGGELLGMTVLVAALVGSLSISLRDRLSDSHRQGLSIIGSILLLVCFAAILSLNRTFPPRADAVCRWLNVYGYFIATVAAVGLVFGLVATCISLARVID